MSLINQVLLDLEKRRASGTDRSALPDHVRALPEMRQNTRLWLIALAGGLAIAMVATWAVLSGFRLPGSRQTPPAPVAVSPAVPIPENKVVQAAASPGAMPDAQPRPEAAAASAAPVPDSQRADLSPEPSNAPATLTEKPPRAADKGPEPRAPIATADVIAKAPPEPATHAQPNTAVSAPAPIATPAPVPPASVSKPETDVKPPAVASRAEESKPKSPAVAAVKLATRAAQPEIDKRLRQLTPQQQAESEYGKATALLNQGRLAEAREAFEAALRHSPGHLGARQALFGLLIEAKNYVEAERVLREGLQLNPGQTGFTMTLARLQVDRGNTQAAIDILQKGMAYAQNNADYHAFLAALLQRQQRHNEAIEQYQAALNLKPQSGVWLMGLGISLQALNRNTEAQDAFRRAKASGNLNADLQAFVDQRLRQLQ